jgi:hypothetical protein
VALRTLPIGVGSASAPASVADKGRGGVPRAVPIVALASALLAMVVSLSHGWPTLYNDAAAHLDIARRITDGLTPGLTQVGSVWLPLPQLLMAPLATVGWLWHTGLAGAIVGAAAFVYSTVRLFALVEDVTGSRRAAWASLVVWVTNLNLLYLQTTPLDEMVMIACTVGAVYHLARWMRTSALTDLALAGGITFLATVTRYDGWALLVAEAVVVAVWSRFGARRRGIVQANLLMMLSIGGYGIVLWLLYNLVIFHDPLYFLHSGYSAQAQQGQQLLIGLLPTKGHVGTSLATLGWAVIDVAGVAVVLAGVAGAALLLGRTRGRTAMRNAAILTVLVAPVAFNVMTLVLGQTTIRVPQMAPYHLFNSRYGLEAMPLLAVCAGSLAGFLRGRMRLLPIVAAAATAVTMAFTTPITLAEGMHGDAVANVPQETAVASFLATHYKGGGVLADDSLDSPLLFHSGLSLSQFVTVGFHPYYERALAQPATTVRWVIVFSGDAIESEMRRHPSLFAAFRPVFRAAPLMVYTLPTTAPVAAHAR